MKQKRTLDDVDVVGKKVLVRVDYNVPVLPESPETISDDSRIRHSLPTLRYLSSQRCKMIICSHFGRPAGKVSKHLRLQFVAERLSELLNLSVESTKECIGENVVRKASALKSGEILMLENLRFHPEEETNDPFFAAKLASLADVYVNDAFGAAHRSHASIVAITQFLPSVAGPLMTKEIETLGQILNNPVPPLGAIFGGAKILDKINVLKNLAPTTEQLFVGGGMSATFLKAAGHNVGDSPTEDIHLEYARSLLQSSSYSRPKVHLPSDVVVGKALSPETTHKIVPVDRIHSGWRILDIGPQTARSYTQEIKKCNTILWNGPMGVFEWRNFSHGTRMLAEYIAEQNDSISIIGGGSTADVIQSLNLAHKMTHVSTGGGASMEFLSGINLPGIACLPDK